MSFSSADRRRRLLTMNTGESAVAVKSALKAKAETSVEPPVPEPLPPPSAHSPIVSLIRREPWKCWAMAMVALAVGIAIVVLGAWQDSTAHPLHQVLGLNAGHASRFFSLSMLLIAGQLSLVNFWYRARSRKDFSGRFVTWMWAAAIWLVFCAMVAGGFHRLLAERLLEQRAVPFRIAPTACWLGCATIAILAIGRLLYREIRHCLSSTILMTLGLAGAAVAGYLELAAVHHETPLTLSRSATTMFWHWCVAAGTLLHTRYVIHVSNEPGRRRPRRIKGRLWWASLPSIPRPKLSINLFRRKGGSVAPTGGATLGKLPKREKPVELPRVETKVAAPATAIVTPAAPRPQSSSAIPSVTAEPVAKPSIAERPAARPAPTSPASGLVSKPPPATPVTPPKTAPQFRIDRGQAPVNDADDDDDEQDDDEDNESSTEAGRELSRKERKKLKKMQRR